MNLKEIKEKLEKDEAKLLEALPRSPYPCCYVADSDTVVLGKDGWYTIEEAERIHCWLGAILGKESE
jgi:hypothetical protein